MNGGEEGRGPPFPIRSVISSMTDGPFLISNHFGNLSYFPVEEVVLTVHFPGYILNLVLLYDVPFLFQLGLSVFLPFFTRRHDNV